MVLRRPQQVRRLQVEKKAQPNFLRTRVIERFLDLSKDWRKTDHRDFIEPLQN